MPELPPSGSLKQFAQEAHKIKNTHSLEEVTELRKVADQLNLKFMGSGVECAVVSHSEGADKVYAISYRHLNPNQAKHMFYTQRVLSTLFPHNFPKFHAGWGELQEERTVSGTIRETVTGVTGGTKEYHPNALVHSISAPLRQKEADEELRMEIKRREIPQYQGQDTAHPLVSAFLELRLLGILNMPDKKADNYILTGEGEYYVDTGITKPIKFWKKEELEEYMESQNMPEKDRHKVRMAIERLGELEKQSTT